MKLSEVTKGTSKSCFRRRSGIWTSSLLELQGNTAAYGEAISVGRCWNRLGVKSAWAGSASRDRDIWSWIDGGRTGEEKGEWSGQWMLRKGMPPPGDRCQVRSCPVPHAPFFSPCFTLQSNELWQCTSTKLVIACHFLQRQLAFFLFSL